MPQSTHETFPQFLERILGTRQWVVSNRLTPRLKAHGYTVALTRKRYGALEQAWERQTHGAPLATLSAAAPEMLALLCDIKALWEAEGFGSDDAVSEPLYARLTRVLIACES